MPVWSCLALILERRECHHIWYFYISAVYSWNSLGPWSIFKSLALPRSDKDPTHTLVPNPSPWFVKVPGILYVNSPKTVVETCNMTRERHSFKCGNPTPVLRCVYIDFLLKVVVWTPALNVGVRKEWPWESTRNLYQRLKLISIF